VPPLRERPEDIPPLVWAFVESLGRRMGKVIKSIPRKNMQQLQAYSWPGNVRELSNVIERAMILTTGESLLVEMPRLDPATAQPRITLSESMKEQILRVLQNTAWRIRGAGGPQTSWESSPRPWKPAWQNWASNDRRDHRRSLRSAAGPQPNGGGSRFRAEAAQP
jgi:formate hydrogenlyase transcriptional activator